MKHSTRQWVAFAALLAMLFSTIAVCPVSAAADAPSGNILSQYDYFYANDDDTLGFVYNDGFFFTDNRQISPELAKVSVALASAAYDGGRLAGLLGDIACSSIAMKNYDKAHTETDYDFVRYAIATRRGIPFQGKTYILYFLPIQGTSGSYDWCGNFKLGTGAKHEGFHLAADEVLAQLAAQMQNDGYTRDTRIILTTGHSRGAAVSNIVAGAELYSILHDNGGAAVMHGHLPQTYLLWINSLYYGYSGWRGNTAIEARAISAPVLTVGPDCFSGAARLNTLEIGETVSLIGKCAFSDCTDLKKLVLSGAVAEVGENAFSGLPDSLYLYFMGSGEEWGRVRIGTGNETLLTAKIHYDPAALLPDLALPAALTEIGAEAFAGGTFSYARLPEQAGAIGPRAFADCAALAYIFVPDGTRIDPDAFENVTQLTILGVSDGAIKAYAEEHGFDYIPLVR